MKREFLSSSFTVGDKIKYNGHVFQIQKITNVIENGCVHCAFWNMKDCSKMFRFLGPCIAEYRLDKKNVIFKQID